MKAVLLFTAVVLMVWLPAGCGVVTGATIKTPTIAEIGVRQYNALAGSAGQASALAGFNVIDPNFIPEEFGKPEYYVADLGVGVPGYPER